MVPGAICAFLAMVWVFWIGFLGSDDGLYWAAAGEWLRHVPYVGDSHWALRHTLVIPIALFRLMFGDGMTAMVLPTLLYAGGLIAVVGIWVRRAAGDVAAAMALVLVVTTPQFVLLSSTANIDVVEAFFVFFACLSMWEGMGRESERSGARSWRVLLLAGVFAGFGMLSRETTAFAVAGVGLLFLAGFGMRRSRYVLVAGGFFCVVGLELLYLYWMTGNVLHRSAISAHHDSTIDRLVDQGAAIPILHPAIDPLTMLLLNHDFGVLGWIGVPLVVWLVRWGRLAAPARRLVLIAVTVSAVWTLVAAELWRLLPLTPRYFFLPSMMVSMLAGVALVRLWSFGWRRMPVVLGAMLLGANALALTLDDRSFMFGEHALVEIAARQPTPIHTDKDTYRRAVLLLSWEHLEERATPDPPKSGDLYLYNPVRGLVWSAPPAGWVAVEHRDLPPTLRGLIAGLIGSDAGILRRVRNALGRGAEGVTLYRVP